MRTFPLVFFSVVAGLTGAPPLSSHGAAPVPNAVPARFEPVTFERNLGQTDARVKYLAHAAKATLWLTADSAVLGVTEKSQRAVLKLRFKGRNRSAKILGEDALPGVSNYFIGSDSSKWRTGVHQFAKVRYQNLYPGIDVVFYGNPQKLEYDFILKPGADPSRIQLVFDGADSLSIDSTQEGSGDLVGKIGDMEIRNHSPRIYQADARGETAVNGRWVKQGVRGAGFSVGAYDPAKTLVVDPVLTYASYVGGNQGDFASAIAMDPQGNIYITGATASSNFPAKAGLSSRYNSQVETGFVAKINPSAPGPASLIYSTYLGGSSFDGGVGIAADASGNAYVTGFTYSSDFPLKNAFQSSFNTSQNCSSSGGAAPCPHVFVSKLSPGGNSLVYSSFLGGSNYDYPSAIAVDQSGNAYVAGQTGSTNFPTKSPFQSSLNGTSDGFLTGVSPDGGSTFYSTYFGGESDDLFNGLAIGPSGVYLGGRTYSTKLPVSGSAFQFGLSGTSSGFVVKLNPFASGSAGLLYSSYLGGAMGDTSVTAVATDTAGKIYATGSTSSSSFPVGTGAIQALQSGIGGGSGNGNFDPPGDAFVTVLDPSGSGGGQVSYSTYLGGEGDEQGTAIAVDLAGRITVAGGTESYYFPTTFDGFQPYPNSQYFQGFITRLDPTQSAGASLLYSTVLGGTIADRLNGVAISASGSTVAVAGETFSPDAPTSAAAYQKIYGGNDMYDGDAYVAVFDFTNSGPVIQPTATTTNPVCPTLFDSGIGNSANLCDSGLSPGLIFTVMGTGLGPTLGEDSQLNSNGRIASTLGGVQVLVNGFPAPLLYVSSTQINAVAPYEIANLAGSAVNVQVIYNGVQGNIPIDGVVATTPAIFSLGNNQGAILNHDRTVNGPNNPASKGEEVVIYGTGEGQLTPVGVDGQIENGPYPIPVGMTSVTINNLPAQLNYAGVALGGFDGFFEVHVVIPTGVASGNVPVVVTVGAVASPPVNVAVK